MDFSAYFKDKKITVMGLGLLGRGVGDVAYMADAGAADIIVTDLKTEDQLFESVQKLEEYSNVRFVLGEHKKEDFEDRDLILVAAGVPLDSPYLAHAREAKVPLKQSAALFLELSKIPMIGVTGTRGKSTVTRMVHHVLSYVTGEQVILGGNIRGVSNLQLLKDVHEDSLAVFELDSWQLQGFGWAEISPQIAVFTNFMEDHMNYYHGDVDLYFKDKAHIFLHQEESGVLVTIPEVFEQIKKLKASLGQEIVLTDLSVIPDDATLAMPGEHNRMNAALAYEALKAVSLTDEEIFEGLASFPGVEGRLQYVKETNGVKIYNDNNATTPSATVAGLKALADRSDLSEKHMVLIAGGAYKDVDPTELAKVIPEYCKKVVLLPGTGTERLLTAAENLSIDRKDWLMVDSLKEAVEEARLAAESGDTVLFSPGFASFGMFVNEYDRNDQFMGIVDNI